jgi:hypothetical protein
MDRRDVFGFLEGFHLRTLSFDFETDNNRIVEAEERTAWSARSSLVNDNPPPHESEADHKGALSAKIFARDAPM